MTSGSDRDGRGHRLSENQPVVVRWLSIIAGAVPGPLFLSFLTDCPTRTLDATELARSNSTVIVRLLSGRRRTFSVVLGKVVEAVPSLASVW